MKLKLNYLIFFVLTTGFYKILSTNNVFSFIFCDTKDLYENFINEESGSENDHDKTSYSEYEYDTSDSELETESDYENNDLIGDSYSSPDIKRLNELKDCRDAFETSEYKTPEKRLNLIKQILFSGKITRIDSRHFLHEFTLSLKSSSDLLSAILKSGYIFDLTGFDFDLNYKQLLELLSQNINDKNNFKPDLICKIINNIPTLEDILTWKYKKINPSFKIEAIDFGVQLPDEDCQAYLKLLFQIGCKDINKEFNFESRKNLLDAISSKICNFNGNRGDFLIKSICYEIQITPATTENNITINGIDLNGLEKAKQAKIKRAIARRINHIYRTILEISFAAKEINSISSRSDSSSDLEDSQLPGQSAIPHFSELLI